MRMLYLLIFLCVNSMSFAHAKTFDEEFEAFKKTASAQALYTFLYAMPKGGDLHNHSTGSNLSEWWYAEILAQQEKGYRYYTKVKINNCRAYGSNEFTQAPYLLLFVNIQAYEYEKLDSCEQSEYVGIQDLNPEQKKAWLNSIRLDKSSEGRDEFFQTHWARINSLMSNPYMQANLIVKNMQAFGAEGLTYLETDAGVRGFVHPDGSPFDSEEVYQIYLERFAQKDALATGVTVRLQYALVRFITQAEDALKWMYEFVASHPELYVGVDMVGREDYVFCQHCVRLGISIMG